MDYIKTYERIIDNAKSMKRGKGKGVYYESHHIIPRCLGGTNDRDNKVLLTAREHFICHKLLCEIYPDNNKLKQAIRVMIDLHKGNLKVNYTARDYELVRIAKVKTLVGENHYRYGKGMPDEVKNKIREGVMKHFETHGVRSGINRNPPEYSKESKDRLISSVSKKRKYFRRNGRGSMPQEVRDRISEGMKKSERQQSRLNKHSWKRFSAINPSTNEREYFSMIKEFTIKYGIHSSNAISCLRGRAKTAHKWSEFRYETNGE